jgi:hypothetical protein
MIKAVIFKVYSAVAQIFCNQTKHYYSDTRVYVMTIYVGRRYTGQILHINHIYKPFGEIINELLHNQG